MSPSRLSFTSTVSGSSIDSCPGSEIPPTRRLTISRWSKARFLWTSACAHFGDDHEIIGIRMERLLDELIGHMGSVVVAGVDVVYARLYRLSQNSNGGINILRRSPNARAGQWHGAIGDAV